MGTSYWALRARVTFFLVHPEQMKRALRRAILDWENRNQTRNLDLRRAHNLLSAGGGKKRKKEEGAGDDSWFEFSPTRIEDLAGEVASLQVEVEDLKESVRLLKDSVRFEKDKAEELFVLLTKGHRTVFNVPGIQFLYLYLARRFSPQLAKDIERNIYNMANRVGQQPNKYLISRGSVESSQHTVPPPSPPRS